MYKEKMKELGITSKYGPYTEQEMYQLEAAMGFKLPSDYKEFLKTFGTLNFHDEDITYDSIENTDEKLANSIVNFYGFENDEQDLRILIARYNGRIPDVLIPIAECPGGDQLCIGIKNKAFGKVYLWDHTKESIEINSPEEMWKALTFIHFTFHDFIMSFKKSEEDNQVDETDVQEIKISDKFLARIRKP